MALTGSIVGFVGGLGKVRLVLELAPQPGSSGGDILAVAILTSERDQRPLEGETITFYLGKEETTAVTTEADGRASHSFDGLGFGAHAVSVQVAGVHVTVRHTFSLLTAKKLASPNVRAEGDEGKYLISASVVYDDGGPARGIPVRLLISKLGKPGERPTPDPMTNEYGLAEHPLEFKEAECDVTWQIRSFEGKITNLHGPSPHPQPKPYQRPSDEELREGSTWDVIRRAWERGAKDAKGA